MSENDKSSKKDVKIAIIVAILCFVLPITLAIAFVAVVLGWGFSFTNRMIDQNGIDWAFTEPSTGKRIDSDYSDSISTIYRAVNSYSTAYASRGDCRNVEYLIKEEVNRDFSICNNNSFSVYAYTDASGYYYFDFIGINDSEGNIAEIKVDSSFEKYYRIAVRKNDGTYRNATEVFYDTNKRTLKNVPEHDVNVNSDTNNTDTDTKSDSDTDANINVDSIQLNQL